MVRLKKVLKDLSVIKRGAIIDLFELHSIVVKEELLRDIFDSGVIDQATMHNTECFIIPICNYNALEREHINIEEVKQ